MISPPCGVCQDREHQFIDPVQVDKGHLPNLPFSGSDSLRVGHAAGCVVPGYSDTAKPHTTFDFSLWRPHHGKRTPGYYLLSWAGCRDGAFCFHVYLDQRWRRVPVRLRERGGLLSWPGSSCRPALAFSALPEHKAGLSVQSASFTQARCHLLSTISMNP